MLSQVGLFTALLVMTSASFSQTPTPTPAPGPKITYNKKDSGLPAIVLDFSDGRRAVSALRGPLALKIQTPFQVTENLCFPLAEKVKCEVFVNYYSAEVTLIWDKHSQIDKIGKPAMLTYPNSTPSDVSRIFDHFGNIPFGNMAGSESDFFQGLALVPGGLKCPNYAWAAGISNPVKLEFRTILDEFMFDNPETGVNENRVMASYHDAKFNFDFKTSQFVSESKNVAEDFVIPVGDTLAFIIERPSATNTAGEVCQISTNHGRAVLVVQFTNNQAKVKATPAQVLFSNLVPPDYLRTVDSLAKTPEGYFD